MAEAVSSRGMEAKEVAARVSGGSGGLKCRKNIKLHSSCTLYFISYVIKLKGSRQTGRQANGRADG